MQTKTLLNKNTNIEQINETAQKLWEYYSKKSEESYIGYEEYMDKWAEENEHTYEEWKQRSNEWKKQFEISNAYFHLSCTLTDFMWCKRRGPKMKKELVANIKELERLNLTII